MKTTRIIITNEKKIADRQLLRWVQGMQLQNDDDGRRRRRE